MRRRKLLWILIPLLFFAWIAVPLIRNPLGTFRKRVIQILKIWNIREERISVGQTHIRYLEGGKQNKNTVILLHGFGGNALLTWMQLLPTLQKKYHVIAPDLLASNFLRLNPHTYSIDQETELVLQLMQALKVERADFIGLSVGGWVSLLFALEHPEKVQRLVLIESAGLRTEIPEIALLTLDDRKKAERFMELLFYRPPPLPNFVLDKMVAAARPIKKKYQAVFAGFIKNSESRLLDSQLANIQQPTLIIHGREDRVIPLDVAQRLHNGIAHSKLIILEASGHAPVWDSPFQLKREILDFLAEPLPEHSLPSVNSFSISPTPSSWPLVPTP